jgi:hypothetical protein
VGIAVGTTTVGGTRVGGTAVGGTAVGGTRVFVGKGAFVAKGVFVGNRVMIGKIPPEEVVEVGLTVCVGVLEGVKVIVGVRVGVAVRLAAGPADVATRPGKRSASWKLLVALDVGTSPYNAVEVKPWWARACQAITPNDKRNKAIKATLTLTEYFRMLKPVAVLASFSACTF